MNYQYCPQCATPLEVKILEGRERPVCPACGAIVYLDAKLAAGCVPRVPGGLVLIKRGIEPGYGLWTFPGGYVDLGEKVEDAATRETFEEAGLTVQIEGLLGLYSFTGRPVAVAVYAAVVTAGEPVPNYECLEARVFSPADIPWDELAFPSTRAALTDWVRWHEKGAPPLGAAPF